MPAKRVVYTVLTGGYETLQEQPAAIGRGVDLICLTDDATLTSPSWQVRHVPLAFASDPIRSARRMKILAHEYLPEYDESLYIDNSVALKTAPDVLFDALLPPDVAMALARHSFRGPLRDEYAAVIEQNLDSVWVCEEQRTHYEQTDPAGLEAPTLWSGFLLRRHCTPDLQAVMQFWWENVLRYSRRDQLSLPIALRTATFATTIHEFDLYSSPYHEWPLWVDETTRPGRIQPRCWPDLRIEELERRVSDLSADLAAMSGVSTRSDALRVERNGLRAENGELVACIEELKRSTSWRVTGPARALSGAMRAGRAGRQEGSPSVRYRPDRGELAPLPHRT